VEIPRVSPNSDKTCFIFFSAISKDFQGLEFATFKLKILSTTRGTQFPFLMTLQDSWKTLTKQQQTMTITHTQPFSGPLVGGVA